MTDLEFLAAFVCTKLTSRRLDAFCPAQFALRLLGLSTPFVVLCVHFSFEPKVRQCLFYGPLHAG